MEYIDNTNNPYGDRDVDIYDMMDSDLDYLNGTTLSSDNIEMVRRMKKFVPEVDSQDKK